MRKVLVILALIASACSSTPDPPAGGEAICEAFGVSKLVYDEVVDVWACIDRFSGEKVYVFD